MIPVRSSLSKHQEIFRTLRQSPESSGESSSSDEEVVRIMNAAKAGFSKNSSSSSQTRPRFTHKTTTIPPQKVDVGLHQDAQLLLHAKHLTLSDINKLQKMGLATSQKGIGELLKECVNLQELDLSYATPNELHTLAPYLKDLKNLKHLKVQHSAIEDLACLADLSNLEQLDLSNCLYLKALPHFKEHAKLQALYLNNCHSLESFQGLENCSKLSWIGTVEHPSFSPLESLKSLALTEKSNLNKLPAWEGPFLQDILPDLIVDLDRSPSKPMKIHHLKELQARIDVQTGVPHSFEDIFSIIGYYPHLDFSEATDEEMAQICLSYNQAQKSEIGFINTNAKNLANIPRHDLLVHLDFRGSCELRSLEGIETFIQLKSLALDGCSQVHSLEPLRKLKHLERLSIEGLPVCNWELSDFKEFFPKAEISGKNSSSLWLALKYGLKKLKQRLFRFFSLN